MDNRQASQTPAILLTRLRFRGILPRNVRSALRPMVVFVYVRL
jgi:hypothetical protein